MKDLYCVGISQNKIASVSLIPYDKGWMIIEVVTPDHTFGFEAFDLVIDDADTEGVILYLGDDPNDSFVYQLPELWYVRYGFHRYRKRFQRRPIYKGGENEHA